MALGEFITEILGKEISIDITGVQASASLEAVFLAAIVLGGSYLIYKKAKIYLLENKK